MSATIAIGMMHQLIVGTVRNNRNPVNLLAIIYMCKYMGLHLGLLIVSI